MLLEKYAYGIYYYKNYYVRRIIQGRKEEYIFLAIRMVIGSFTDQCKSDRLEIVLIKKMYIPVDDESSPSTFLLSFINYSLLGPLMSSPVRTIR